MLKWMVPAGKKLWKDEDGLGTLEVLLIVAVLVIIAIAFRKWIFAWIEKVFGESNGQLTNTGSLNTCTDPTKTYPNC
ncbi:Flp1 family type IVb pilin [Paenibacillus hamazuiensis]|uniref:Flp1 family type IVb pilin n=1 Tax=Paenibacillus hamazuiensis TaxID=2936508 RepID=UPI00200BEF20|nr:Flp1 family type IVb pilin [Paenibacillus hamazuiensis]